MAIAKQQPQQVDTGLDPALIGAPIKPIIETFNLDRVPTTVNQSTPPTTIINTTIVQVQNVTPGGNNNDVQFQENSSLVGDSNFEYDPNTETLHVINLVANSVTTQGIVNLGAVSNLQVSGGTNGQVLKSDGYGNLYFSNVFPNALGNIGKALIAVNDHTVVWGNVNYNYISNTPTLSTVATSGNYNDLHNKPNLSTVAISGSYTDLVNIPTFSRVATSGSYSDLTNTPNIPNAQIPSDWLQSNITSLDYIKNKPALFSGDYNDLSNKPSLPNQSLNTNNSPSFTNLTVTGNLTPGNIYTNNYYYSNGDPLLSPDGNFTVTSVIAVDLKGDGGNISNIQGTNVSGAVSYATTANSVSIANVSGIGNIATLNLDGNTSNILYGNGHFASAPIPYTDSNVETLLASFGSNTITTTGNVSVGNIIGNGQSLTGLNGANVTGQVSNALVSSTVYSSSQPNITNIGNLTSFTVQSNNATNNSTVRIKGNGNGDMLSIATSGTGGYGIGLTVQNYNLTSFAPFKFVANTMSFSTSNGGAPVATLTLNANSTANFAGNVTANGNITANYFIGNGSQLTGLPASYTDSNVTTLLANLGSNNIFSTSGNIYAGGNLQANTVIIYGANGTINTTNGTKITMATSRVDFNGNIVVTGNVSANIVTANFSGNGASLSSITGGNVTGAVSYATTANSVALANVSGIGNIANINLNGSNSQVLYGNGVFAAVSGGNGAKITISDTSPNSASAGDLWFESDVGVLRIYYSNTWVEANPASTSSTPTSVTSTNVITATTTNPTKASTTITDYITVIDDGTGYCTCMFSISWTSSSGAANGSGQYLFTLPGGYQINSTYHPFNTNSSQATDGSNTKSIIPGSVMNVSVAGYNGQGVIVAHDSTHFKLVEYPGTQYYNSSTRISSDNNSFVSDGNWGMAQGTNVCYSGQFRFKKV